MSHASDDSAVPPDPLAAEDPPPKPPRRPRPSCTRPVNAASFCRGWYIDEWVGSRLSLEGGKNWRECDGHVSGPCRDEFGGGSIGVICFPASVERTRDPTGQRRRATTLSRPEIRPPGVNSA
jgi:hypothetical protein